MPSESPLPARDNALVPMPEPEGEPVDVPLPFLLAVAVPVVAVMLFFVLQLSSRAQRRAEEQALRDRGLDPDELE